MVKAGLVSKSPCRQYRNRVCLQLTTQGEAVYRRSRLGPGFTARGPLIVEEDESTTVAGSGATVEVDDGGSLLIRLPRNGSAPA